MIDYVVADYKKDPRRSYVIHGHTDAQGSAAYNKRLAQRRAN